MTLMFLMDRPGSWTPCVFASNHGSFASATAATVCAEERIVGTAVVAVVAAKIAQQHEQDKQWQDRVKIAVHCIPPF